MRAAGCVADLSVVGMTRCTRCSGIGNTLRMFGFTLTNEAQKRVEVVSTGGEKISPPLTDFVNQKVDKNRPGGLTAHPSSSIHSISGVTTCGVSSPRRRLITVRCAILCGLARCRMFQVRRKSNS